MNESNKFIILVILVGLLLALALWVSVGVYFEVKECQACVRACEGAPPSIDFNSSVVGIRGSSLGNR